jgi:hypothetical protein
MRVKGEEVAEALRKRTCLSLRRWMQVSILL